jgi:hypothetical protein
MDSLSMKCSFCGKRKAEAKILMLGLIGNWDREQLHNGVCDECLGLQMATLANLNRDLFERLVEVARGEKSEPQHVN